MRYGKGSTAEELSSPDSNASSGAGLADSTSLPSTTFFTPSQVFTGVSSHQHTESSTAKRKEAFSSSGGSSGPSAAKRAGNKKPQKNASKMR